MKRFVLDASVALAWFIDRPMSPYAALVKQRLIDGNRAVVPTLWRLEVANGFIMTEKRGILSPTEIGEALQALEIVVSQSVEDGLRRVPMRQVISTAREFRLTAYEAEYLDIARLEQLHLATLDRHLQDAATKAGIPLFG